MWRGDSGKVTMGFMSESRKKDEMNKEAGNWRQDRRELVLNIMITSQFS